MSGRDFSEDRELASGETDASYLPTLPGRVLEEDPSLIDVPKVTEEDLELAMDAVNPTLRSSSLPPGASQASHSFLEDSPGQLSGSQMPRMPRQSMPGSIQPKLKPPNPRGVMTRRQASLAALQDLPESSSQAVREESQLPDYDSEEKEGSLERGFAKATLGKREDEPEAVKKRTFRRSKSAEEQARRVKERNRRAQQAFRDRQKALSSERSESYRQLEANLAKANAEKADLANRVKYLEIRMEEESAAGTGLGVDASPLCLTVFDEPVTYSSSHLKAMNLPDLISLYKVYVDAMRVLLQRLELRDDADDLQRISILVGETQALQQSLAALNSRNFLQFQVANLAGTQLDKPTDQHWAQVLDAMGFTDNQIRLCLDLRLNYLLKLKPLLQHRWEINQSLLSSFGPVTGVSISGRDIHSARAKAHEACRALVANLREEQQITLAAWNCRQQQVATPKQKALKMTASWPWYPDTLAMGNVIAKMYGAPTARDILGTDCLAAVQLNPLS